MTRGGAFEDYKSYTVRKNGEQRIYGPWTSESQARADKARQIDKDRTVEIVEADEAPDPDEVFSDE